jgi:hypothetical protein
MVALRILLLAGVLACGAAIAQDRPPAGHTHAPGAPRPDVGASAAFDASGTLWAVYKQGAHVMLRRSDDAGATWSTERAVNAAPEGVGADGDARPKIAIGAKGELFVTWTQPLAKPYTGLIRFARSTDGGRTFAAPVTVHTDRQEITHRFDALAVNRAGQLFIAWIDKRDAVAAAGKPYQGAALYYAVSDDGGATFRGDFRVADHSCECCRIALIPRDDGSVIAFWRHVFEPNVRDHALARLEPGGKSTGMRRATFDNWRLDACPHHGPSLAADEKGALHGVWYSGTPGAEGVYYGRLVDGRVDGQRRLGGGTAEHADIAASGERVVIAWREFDGTRSHLKAARSDDAGASWREMTLASGEGATDHPKVLVRRGDFVVLWNGREQPLRVVAVPSADARDFGTRSLAAIQKENAGKPFVLALWSVHCEPCMREMAVWRAMQQKYPGVQVALVATDPPAERARVTAFLRRFDPGPVERWWYADEFETRYRFAIDPKWRGELPRTYFFDAAHKPEAHTGVLDPQWVASWFAAAATP